MFIPPPHFYRQNIFLHLVACVLRTRGETASTIRETGDLIRMLGPPAVFKRLDNSAIEQKKNGRAGESFMCKRLRKAKQKLKQSHKTTHHFNRRPFSATNFLTRRVKAKDKLSKLWFSLMYFSQSRSFDTNIS